MLAACSTAGPPGPARTAAAQVAAIRAAGAHEQSVIDVQALPDPSVAALLDAATAAERAGRYAEAAARLDQALQRNPASPDLLQQRAEIAILLGDDVLAEKLARRSWEIGPQLGPLCARNWQTIAEMRDQAGDAAAASRAQGRVQDCHKAGVPRY